MTENTFALSQELSHRIVKCYFEFLGSLEGQLDPFTDAYVAEARQLNSETLIKVLKACFGGSLAKEEGKHHQFSVYVSPPEQRFAKLLEPYAQKHFCGYFENVCSFEKPVEIAKLSKIATAFESTNQKLRVWFNSNGEIEIWGFAKSYFDDLALEITTFLPGQLLIHTKPRDFPRDRFLLTFSETEKVITTFSLLDLLLSESELSKLNITEDKENWLRLTKRRDRRYGFLIDIINKMSSHANGGTVLFVPESHWDSVLSESIKQPITYRPEGGFDAIKRRLIAEENEHVYSYTSQIPNSTLPWSFQKDADFLGQLTAVDGATILTKDFEVLAFGAKIKESSASGSREICIQRPFEGKGSVSIDISDFGGTRHQSAAHFVMDQLQKDVFAIVASQDGRVSIIFWDKVNNRLTALTQAEYLYYGLKF
jgi:sensor domain DACNV-containing protein